jgi:NAD-dependent SIR2 family protein deacetylase
MPIRSVLTPLPLPLDDSAPSRNDPLDRLIDLLRGQRFAVLSGAGCSTDSGIPDYRGPSGQLRRRQPIQYLEFLHSDATRRRYWARSAVGWPVIARAQPNAAHHALAQLERAGCLAGLITQNVDGLHLLAGSREVIELHGSLFQVRCLACGAQVARAALQDELLGGNPALAAALATTAPDGDADIDEALHEGLVAPQCRRCGGLLKPDVVFFGENVPRPTVDAAWAVLARSSALVVLGSSLAVYSGFRFVRGAAERGLPIAIINQGPTRGDELATVRMSAPLGPVLSELAMALLG